MELDGEASGGAQTLDLFLTEEMLYQTELLRLVKIIEILYLSLSSWVVFGVVDFYGVADCGYCVGTDVPEV